MNYIPSECMTLVFMIFLQPIQQSTVLLLKPSSLAIVSLAFGKYALYPILKTDRFDCPSYQDGGDEEWKITLAVRLIAVVIACRSDLKIEIRLIS